MYVNGHYLRKIRLSLGLGMKEVAVKIGCSFSSINKIEKRDNSRCEIALLVRLAKIYNLDIETLINYEEVEKDLKKIEEINRKYPKQK